MELPEGVAWEWLIPIGIFVVATVALIVRHWPR
jgi:hypothetical protein